MLSWELTRLELRVVWNEEPANTDHIYFPLLTAAGWGVYTPFLEDSMQQRQQGRRIPVFSYGLGLVPLQATAHCFR